MHYSEKNHSCVDIDINASTRLRCVFMTPRPGPSVSCNVSAIGCGLVEGPTKNHTARAAPMPASLTRLLETEIADRDGDALAFTSARSGGHLTLGQARYTFAKATIAVDGCNGVRLHDLRHTCASLAISAGANVKVVQRLVGHKTAVLTPDRYGHLFPDDLDAVATAFDAAAATTADWPAAQTRCCGTTYPLTLVAGPGFEPG
jgi:integrase